MQEIFLAAVECQRPDDQQAYLDQACADDEEMRRQVDLLLKAHHEAGSVPGAGAAEPGRTGAYGTAAEAVATVIGPYKLLEQIGEGGMGAVWMAQQTEPVKRLVAIKLIKAGMDSKQVIARFEAERQALALMDHANIARVLDAGTTDAGRPYFVMDLVKGVPITRYCDEHHLTPKQRLELFVPVCQAVQHAHQKGIIHRDLKPSNVLVALYDGKPVPKVIDFGVAKAAGQPLTEKTLVTGFGNIVGTLEYMSPEQAEINQLDIDTRSDIYSLGVLLYELLTGSPPLTKKDLEKAGMLEMLRVIREQEPSKPSTKLSTAESLPTLAANRGTEPAKLTKLVRGELDWIVMKALEKDRNRRYETANGFAMDVQRYLADEPVLACPPSAWYRCGKFTRRHKMGLAVTGLALCLLASLVGGIGWAVRDRAARQAKVVNDLDLALERGELFQRDGKPADARAALDRAERLAVEAPADRARHERLASLKERLAAEARDQAFLTRFEDIWLRVASQVNVEQSWFTSEAAYPEIREALGRYGIAVGVMAPTDVAARVQGRPEPVRGYLIAALGECLRRAPKEDAQTRRWLLAALAATDNDAWRMRARQAWVAGDWQTLEQLAKGADVRKQPPSLLLLLATNLPGPMGPTRLELLRRIQRSYPADLWANHDLAYELWKSGRPAEAIRYYTAALALRPDNPGIYVNRGSALRDAGEVNAAIVDFQQAVALAPRYAVAHNNLGNALRAKGQVDDAIAAYRVAIRLKKDLPEAHSGLGNALRDQGQLDEAIAAYREAVRLKKDYAEAHNNLGNALRDKGQVDDAIGAYREAIRLKKDLPLAHNNLGLALTAKGQLDEAIAAYREAIRHKPDFAEAHCNLGSLLRRQGRFVEALKALRHGHKLGSQRPDWRYPSASWVQQAERLVAHDKLPDVLSGKVQPADTAERLALARFCQEHKKRYAAAARFYAEAFVAEPKLIGAQPSGHRYNAACAAALAGCGQGEDAKSLDDKERTRLRRQALDWLRAELAGWRRLLENEPAKARAAVMQQLQHWQNDPDFAGVRGSKALGQLPAAERPGWQKLWQEVEELRQSYRNHLRGLTQTCAGQADRGGAVAAAQKRRDLGWDPPADAYDAACALALCIPLVQKSDEREAGKRRADAQFYADEAMKMLRDAIAKGYQDTAHVKQDKDLDALRERADFQKLLAWLQEPGHVYWSGRHLYSTGFSPDSRYYYATGDANPAQKNTTRVWETATGKLVCEVVGNESAAFTPDGKRLLCPGPDKALHLWDLATGKEIRSFKGHTNWVTTVAISPDGKRALSGSNDTTVRVWDLEAGTELKKIAAHTQSSRALFAPDGKHFLTYAAAEDRTLRLWDAATYKEVRSWVAPGDNWFVAFAPDGLGFLTSTYGDGTVHWWDLKKDKAVRSLKLEGNPVNAAGFSSDCRRLIYAVAKDNTIRLVDRGGGKEVARFEVPTVPMGVMAISPDGRFASGASGNGWVYLWRLPPQAAKPPR
jgi:serine/threonine protein kinase/Flp pilus assembly protein TadD